LVLLEVAVQESVADIELSDVEIKAGGRGHHDSEGRRCRRLRYCRVSEPRG
jgi:hypothetical protein